MKYKVIAHKSFEHAKPFPTSGSAKRRRSPFHPVFLSGSLLKEASELSLASTFKPLPIGDQNFERLIQLGRLYIDKTAFIIKLLQNGDKYFLSRPRRFGKTLLLTTLRALFEGKKDLFKGLAIVKTDYDFEQYPVIFLDLSEIKGETKETVERQLKNLLLRKANELNLKIDSLLPEKGTEPYEIFADLIEKLYFGHNKKRVVVLIDEYDFPIVNNLDRNNLDEIAKIMKNFYSVIKNKDGDMLHFTFVTGITNFGKANMFSGLNHLTNITLDETFAAISGITEDELTRYLEDRLAQMKAEQKQYTDLLESIRFWYDGYQFSESSVRVYNPYSTLLFFSQKRFRNYWFETGTPTMLVEFVRRTKNFDLRQFEASFSQNRAIDDLGLVNISDLLEDLEILMYQTGYLTIDHASQAHDQSTLVALRYPNAEVKKSFLDVLLKYYYKINNGGYKQFINEVVKHLLKREVDDFLKKMQIFFAGIPYDTIPQPRELSYQGIFYAVIRLIGFDIIVEKAISSGRIDCVLKTRDTIYIFEFKLDKESKSAIDQIKEREYHKPYILENKHIIIVGVNFNTTDRNIEDGWLKEQYHPKTNTFSRF